MTDAEAIARLQIARTIKEPWPIHSKSSAEQAFEEDYMAEWGIEGVGRTVEEEEADMAETRMQRGWRS